MEELLPIAFAIVWLLFSGIFGKANREKAKRDAETRREAAEAARRAREQQRGAPRESRDAGGRTFAAERDDTLFTGTTASGSRAGSADGDETSVDMIPDELWNILTGGAPRPTQPPRQPVPEREPVPDGGWVTSPPWDEEDALNSIEGVSAEEIDDEVVDYDEDADRIARARYEDIKATSWDSKPTSRDAIAVREDETIWDERRHFEFHESLRDDEIGSAAAATRRVSTREWLGLRSLGDVRRAIVVAEVLGPPKSLR